MILLRDRSRALWRGRNQSDKQREGVEAIVADRARRALARAKHWLVRGRGVLDGLAPPGGERALLQPRDRDKSDHEEYRAAGKPERHAVAGVANEPEWNARRDFGARGRQEADIRPRH